MGELVLLGLWVWFWGGRKNGVYLGYIEGKEVMGGFFGVVFCVNVVGWCLGWS